MTTPRTTAVAALAALTLAATGCSASVEPDEQGLEYNAGAFSSTEFDQCVKPGTREYRGLGDFIVKIPGGQRTYTLGDKKKSAEAPAAKVVTKDDQTMNVEVQVTFSLNPDCKTLQDFYERIGRKFDVDTDAGWVKFLNTYLGAALNKALDDATKKYGWKELYASADTKQAWEEEVSKLLVSYIEEQGGGEFFVSPTFTGAKGQKPGAPQLLVQQPTPGKKIIDSLTKKAAAIENTAAQEEINKALQMEAEGLDPLIKRFDGDMDAVVLYLAMQRGDVAMVPGVGLSVAPKD